MSDQLIVLVSTFIVFVLSALLAVSLTVRYKKTNQRSFLFWSIGMWLFVIGVLLEIFFAYGIYSQPLIAAYLFVVALLVEFLSLGSLQLVKSTKIRYPYYAYALLAAVFVLYSVATTNIGNILSDYVVFGALPILVVISSSIATLPAAILIIAVAAKEYMQTKSKRLLSIMAGVIIVSVGGTLYIVQVPEFLYFVEFIGIFLLWFGFADTHK